MSVRVRVVLDRLQYALSSTKQDGPNTHTQTSHMLGQVVDMLFNNGVETDNTRPATSLWMNCMRTISDTNDHSHGDVQRPVIGLRRKFRCMC